MKWIYQSKLHLFLHVYTLVWPIVTRVAFLLPNHSEYVHSFIKPDRQRWIYNYYSCYVDSRGEGWKFAFSLKSLKICLVPYRDEPLALIFTPHTSPMIKPHTGLTPHPSGQPPYQVSLLHQKVGRKETLGKSLLPR